MISCILVNSAISARARVRSSSHTHPISYIVWRQIACTCSKISCMVSITRCLEESSPLPSASTGRDFPGVDASVGDASAPSYPSSRCNAACLASRRCWSVPCIKGRTRSETMFQWSLDGGLRVIANFGLWKSSWGIISDSYSNRGEELLPKRRGKPTQRVRSSPGCWVQTVWSLKPLSWTGAGGSSLAISISLVATSNRTGCCIATGSTLLISERLTKRSQDEVTLSSDSVWEPAMCHTFRRM